MTRSNDLADVSVNTLRMLAVDAVERARSGHPGAPMGAAAMAYTLWQRHLRHHPEVPEWPDRDRFVLSMGHASMLLYGLLHLSGYDLTVEDLRAFRQWASRTPGHPEFGATPGVECTTGPLGQGLAMGVGMALAERLLAARYNTCAFELFNHVTWVLCSDGDLMEGVSAEAASLAGHWRLGKLICLYDDNQITIDGSTDLAFTENVAERFKAYQWHVQGPIDGLDIEEVDAALQAAKADERPSLIIARTTIGFGSPGKAGSADAHGSPLGPEEARATRRHLGWPEQETFVVPEPVREHMDARPRGEALHEAWMQMMARYLEAFPEEGARLQEALAGRLPQGWDAELPLFESGSKPVATRNASGKILNALAPRLDTLTGGSADLSPSNKTVLEGYPDHSFMHPEGRNLRFGVREHAMGAICNGLALHGGVRPYAGTFLIFSDYMRPAIRLAALQGLPVVYVFTHDSIGLGEDGPTHQPIEQTMSLRLIPNMQVIRPADANETVQAWRLALERNDGPTALLLSRQDLPVLDPRRTEGTRRGGYVLSRTAGAPRVVLIGTGSEVHLALETKALLEQAEIPTQVVSLPCWELFARQPSEYRDEVLPTAALKVAVEAGATLGWERWTGGPARVIGLDRFGASAPSEVLFRELGFTAEALVERVRRLLEG